MPGDAVRGMERLLAAYHQAGIATSTHAGSWRRLMRRKTFLTSGCAALAIVGLLATAPARAEMSDHPGGGPGEMHDHGPDHPNDRGHDEHARDDQGRDDHGRDTRARDDHGRPHFAAHDRVAVHDYYGDEFRHGRCPPGLAKKHDGCLPPGKARRWEIGRPLPRDVIFYDVPQPLLVHLAPAPHGYRYVRVSNDILLISAVTGLVVDAIRDLGAG
jgi:Ni/Co efflux regulator RcnB